MSNKKLHNAKKAKNDEFYTRMIDVENEVKHYHEQLRDKVVLCPCDGENSNFTRYFVEHFNEIGLKKLICTCYNKNGRGRKYVLERGNEWCGELNGDGDFMSDEIVQLIDKADAIITNPPFSKALTFYGLLLKHEKKFLILGTTHQIAYSTVAADFIENKIWVGFTGANRTIVFDTPDGEKEVSCITWLTNIDAGQKISPTTFTKKYYGHEAEYPKYDNCDAIDASKWINVPGDYYEAIGVPISAVGKISREQFEVLGIMRRNCKDKYTCRTKIYTKEEKKNHNDLNAGPVLVEDGIYRVLYTRIIIRRKT